MSKDTKNEKEETNVETVEETMDLSQKDIDELDGAVDEAMSQMKKDQDSTDINPEAEEDKKETNPPADKEEETQDPKEEKEKQEDKKSPDSNKEADKTEDKQVSDEQLTKAVAAGISIAEAKALGPDLLESMISRLDKSENKNESKKDESGGEDLLSKIPDLDPNDWEPEIVDGFKTMKDIIKQQNEIIAGLKGGSETSFFDGQVATLSEGVQKVLKDNPVKAEALKTKYNVFLKGYESSGIKVDEASVFEEAAQAVLSKEIAESKDQSKQASLKKRESTHIQRPGGPSGKPKGDVADEIAAEIDRKYFND